MRPCPECSGLGYAVFTTDALGHPPVEVERNDACDCLYQRGRAEGWWTQPDYEPTDDDAAVAFVRDLEKGERLAIRHVHELLSHHEKIGDRGRPPHTHRGVCVYPECFNSPRTRGLCHQHYQAVYRKRGS